MELRNATYWDIVTPLRKNDILDSGFPDTPEGIAQCGKAVSALMNLDYWVSIELLETIEHDLPDDDPEYDCSNNFYSKRLCVIIYGP